MGVLFKKKKKYTLINPCVPYVFSAPIILVLLFIVAIPLLFGLMLSFTI